MTTRRYCSPLGRDIDTSKANKGMGWKGLKGHMALALAVSLWIATGGVAGATGPANIYILSDGSVNIKNTIKDQSCVGTMTVSADKKTLSIGGTWSSPTLIDPSCNGYYIYARNATLSGQDTGYTLSVNGATFNNVGYLTMYGVANGQSGYPLSDNHVVITDSEFIRDATIYGGYVDYADTIQNTTITIAGTLDANGKPKTSFSGGNQYIYTAGCNAINPGSEYTFSNNTINLYGAAAMESVTFNTARWNGGIAPSRNNNELHLGGTKSGQTANGIAFSAWQGYNADGTVVNNTVNSVGGFDKIVLHKVKWDTSTPALKATNGFTGFGGGLDISGMTFEGTPAGTMTLLQGTTGNFSTLNLTYNNGTTTSTVALGDTNPTSQVVKNVVGGISADKGVTLTYNAIHSVSIADTSKVTYSIGNTATGITLGNMTFGTPRALTAGDFDFTGVTNANINTTNFKFTNPESATGTITLLTNATNLVAGTNIAHTQNFTKAVNGATLSATLSGNLIRTTAGQIGYTATGTALTGVNLAGWNGTASSVPAGWTSGLTANSVTAAGFTAPTIDAGTSKDILTTATDNFFSDTQITGAMKYAQQADSSDTVNGVTLTGAEYKGVKASADGKSLVYARSNFDVSNISLGEMTWGTSRDASGTGYDYSNAAVNIDGLTFSNPEAVSDATTTLLKANSTFTQVIPETTKNISYGYSPVDGVTVDGIINGSYKTDSNAIKYTATANNATKLTFGNVAWKDTGALMTRPSNITFNGAAVDTSNINFTNIKELEANKNMTLVSNFGDSVGTITGTKYKVGSTLQGEGKASLEEGNLIFTTDTRAEKMTVQEQTHNTVMGAEVGMAALSAGNDFVGAATEGLSMAGNTGTDGMATYANMGGGSMNVETGSHVKTHTWNAILALGHKNEKKLSTTEYGAFFEYGTGNYSTFNGDERGDGSTRYTGGGILGKWQKNNGFYVEGSLRAGSIHDDANNVLRDAAGNPYSYTTDATYWGAHIGVGREIKLNKTAVLDLYAKYFYNHRGSVSFDAGGHYDLGAVESSVLRVGTRYTVKQNDNINYYGGLAVEHEFCGRASGFADGVAIRGADISGTSVRGEIGATFRPGEKSNVTLDLNLSGFAGKKQGLTGGLSAVFHI